MPLIVGDTIDVILGNNEVKSVDTSSSITVDVNYSDGQRTQLAPSILGDFHPLVDRFYASQRIVQNGEPLRLATARLLLLHLDNVNRIMASRPTFPSQTRI